MAKEMKKSRITLFTVLFKVNCVKGLRIVNVFGAHLWDNRVFVADMLLSDLVKDCWIMYGAPQVSN